MSGDNQHEGSRTFHYGYKIKLFVHKEGDKTFLASLLWKEVDDKVRNNYNINCPENTEELKSRFDQN